MAAVAVVLMAAKAVGNTPTSPLSSGQRGVARSLVSCGCATCHCSCLAPTSQWPSCSCSRRTSSSRETGSLRRLLLSNPRGWLAHTVVGQFHVRGRYLVGYNTSRRAVWQNRACALCIEGYCRPGRGMQLSIPDAARVGVGALHGATTAWSLLSTGESVGTILALLGGPYLVHVAGWPALGHRVCSASCGLYGAVLWRIVAVTSRRISSSELALITASRPPRPPVAKTPWRAFLRSRSFRAVIATRAATTGHATFRFPGQRNSLPQLIRPTMPALARCQCCPFC